MTAAMIDAFVNGFVQGSIVMSLFLIATRLHRIARALEKRNQQWGA